MTPGSSGYTANLVTGVWLGNDDNSPTKKATGGGLPVEVWTRFMKAAHQNVAAAPLPGSTQSPAGFLSNLFPGNSRTPAREPYLRNPIHSSRIIRIIRMRLRPIRRSSKAVRPSRRHLRVRKRQRVSMAG